MNEGWLCPKCGNAHAPHVNSCPMGADWQKAGAFRPWDSPLPSLEPAPNPWRGNDVPVTPTTAGNPTPGHWVSDNGIVWDLRPQPAHR